MFFLFFTQEKFCVRCCVIMTDILNMSNVKSFPTIESYETYSGWSWICFRIRSSLSNRHWLTDVNVLMNKKISKVCKNIAQ